LNKNSKIKKSTNEQRSKNNRTKSKGVRTTYPKEVLINNGGRTKKQGEMLRSKRAKAKAIKKIIATKGEENVYL
jgi:hypothetical protein